MRVRPLLNIHGTWETGRGYPDTVDIAMRDGRVVRYSLMVHAVNIHAGKNGWEQNGTMVTGYKFREKKKPMKKVTSFLHRQANHKRMATMTA